MELMVPFGSGIYLGLLCLIGFGRGMDFLSTWIATPNLDLEANPIARRMGWKWGLVFNVGICFVFPMWPLPAIIITTTSLLVAARNLQSAWLMRSMGEQAYRLWFSAQLENSPRWLYFFCLVGQTTLYALIGAGLVYFSRIKIENLVPFAVGVGFIAYSLAVLIYSTLSVWRMHSRKV